MDQNQNPSAAPPDLSKLLDKLLAHPEIISMVAATLGGGGGSGTSSATDTAAPQEAKPDPPNESPTAEASAAESPPAIPAGLGDMLSGLSPLLSKLSGAGAGKSSPHGKGENDHRACLLRALKPYLNPSRQEAIDYMIRLSELSLLLKHLY